MGDKFDLPSTLSEIREKKNKTINNINNLYSITYTYLLLIINYRYNTDDC